MAYRSAKPSTYGVMGTSVPSYNADTWTGGMNNKSFDKEFGSVYGHNGNYGNNDVYGKWSNYGSVGSSGNVFGDDYKLSDYTSPNVKSEYEQTKANWQNELDLYKQAYENYKGTLSSASEQRQKAYIRKQYDIKNAMEQSTALGRGGLGTTESGYNRINNNYLNTYNGINDQANETLDDVLNDYKNAYNNIQNQNRLLEQLAKDKQTDYWTQYFTNYLDGLDDKVGAIDAAKNTEPLAYGDNKEVESYIDRESENELLEYIKAYKNAENRSYFLDGKDFEDTANNYIDVIKGLGSENEAYNDFIKATRVQAGNYENAARDSHGDYIVDGVYQYLNGDDSGGEIGMLNALSNKQIKYNNGTEDVTVGSYLDSAEEQRLKDYLNKTKTDNAYFYGGDGKKDADTIFQQYYDMIEAQGSKNQPYQDYLKYDAEQKEKAEMVKPENFAKRGAVANVSNFKTGYGAWGRYTKCNVDGVQYNLVQDMLFNKINPNNFNTEVNKIAPNQIQGKQVGDVIEVRTNKGINKYILYKPDENTDAYWCKLEI